MPAYADFEFYTETYLGNVISETDFPRLALRASMVIDQITFGQAGPVVEADIDAETIELICMAACAVADELQTQEAGGQIQSERVGQHAVTYNVAPAVSIETRLAHAARLYLWNTSLMYRGVCE